MTRYVHAIEAEPFLRGLHHRGVEVDLFLVDPPYMGIVKDSWDNQWKSVADYREWLYVHLAMMKDSAARNASLLIFQAIGVPGRGEFPIDSIRNLASNAGWSWRNWITWKKRRAYGKSHDYLFCREEIFWFSASPERKSVTFNIPLLDVKRGYPGWSKKYSARSEYKRVSNVWDDIPELMRPERNTQKPEPLIARLVETHSNQGDLVVDTFAGWGTTGVAARRLGRNFIGCEAIAKDADAADARVRGIRVP